MKERKREREIDRIDRLRERERERLNLYLRITTVPNVTVMIRHRNLQSG